MASLMAAWQWREGIIPETNAADEQEWQVKRAWKGRRQREREKKNTWDQVDSRSEVSLLYGVIVTGDNKALCTLDKYLIINELIN